MCIFMSSRIMDICHISYMGGFYFVRAMQFYSEVGVAKRYDSGCNFWDREGRKQTLHSKLHGFDHTSSSTDTAVCPSVPLGKLPLPAILDLVYSFVDGMQRRSLCHIRRRMCRVSCRSLPCSYITRKGG